MNKKILIIIPAYNEEKNIVQVISELKDNYPQYDYLVVNDGSRDKTGELCEENDINHINLSINLGLSDAVQTGMLYAWNKGYGFALQYDGDGQHVPSYISKLIQTQQEHNLDIVIGSRFADETKPKTLRMFGSNLIQFAIKLTTGKEIKDPTSGMRLYNRKMIEEFANNTNFSPEPDTIAYLIKNGVKYQEVQVEMRERQFGESYLNLKNSVKYMIQMAFSIILIMWFRERKIS